MLYTHRTTGYILRDYRLYTFGTTGYIHTEPQAIYVQDHKLCLEYAGLVHHIVERIQSNNKTSCWFHSGAITST